jgi:hypothetical protein
VRPKFAGHKQALPARIVRNAIQDGFRIASIRRTQQPVNINPSHNGAILRRNPRDPIAVPYVRKIWPSTNSKKGRKGLRQSLFRSGRFLGLFHRTGAIFCEAVQVGHRGISDDIGEIGVFLDDSEHMANYFANAHLQGLSALLVPFHHSLHDLI